MTDTCIVCLLDLDTVDFPLPPDFADDALPAADLADDGHIALPSEPRQNEKSPISDGNLVARLPCGHFLHNDCLKPWVERANSCPTCRANFNVVELVAKIGGPVLSTYVVKDKRQVAEIDRNLIFEDDFDIEEAFDEEEDDDEDDGCIICDGIRAGPGPLRMLQCSECQRYCHIFCAGLDTSPRGHWLCPNCIEAPHAVATARRRARPNNRQPHHRRRAPSRETNAWARVWQSVWHNLHIDLDYPFDDDEAAAHIQQEQEEAQRRELNEWHRRFRLASRQGAGDRFRQSAAAILQQQQHPPQPAPESQDELRAWNAFEKAREARDIPANRRKRKSKSTSTSPKEPDSEPQQSERVLKRPRTRRAQDAAVVVASSSVAESSRRSPNTRSNRRRSFTTSRPDSETGDSRPSFLSSLLKEVEVGAKSESPSNSTNLVPVLDLSDRASSPQASSPGASPTSSNHPTSRAGTPPPISLTRPSSPPPISSTVRPIYPLAPNFSPSSQGSPDGSHSTERQSRPRHHHQTHTNQSRSLSPPRRKDASPPHKEASSPRISLSTKSEIQSMVRAALDTLYHQRKVTKDQYTDINQTVSRMLYDRIGDDAEALAENRKMREKWQNIATQEVENAVKALKDEKGKESAPEEKGKAPLPPSRTRVVVATPAWSPTVQAGGES